MKCKVDIYLNLVSIKDLILIRIVEYGGTFHAYVAKPRRRSQGNVSCAATCQELGHVCGADISRVTFGPDTPTLATPSYSVTTACHDSRRPRVDSGRLTINISI